MQIDILWIRTWFARFNRQYFGDALPTPRFRIGRSRTRLGTLSFKQKSRWGRTPAYDFALSMSNYYDQTEHGFKSVLLHEMIHLSIAHCGIKDTSPHGVVFRGMMERINRDGRDIHVMTRVTGMKKAHTGSDTVIRQYLVLALETTDGKRFLSSVDPKYAKALARRLPTIGSIASHAWYTTDDRWFEDMPRVRSLRGRRVCPDIFREKTSAMRPVSLLPDHSCRT